MFRPPPKHGLSHLCCSGSRVGNKKQRLVRRGLNTVLPVLCESVLHQWNLAARSIMPVKAENHLHGGQKIGSLWQL